MGKGLTNKRNLLHIEIMRILAIYLVMFNHTGDKGYLLFTNAQSSPFYFVYMFMSMFCACAVPVFYMISGALLLKKEEDLGTIFKKRVLKYVILLFVISGIYFIYKCWGEGFGPSYFLIQTYIEPWSDALWYMYSYIAVLMMLPFLRKIANGIKTKEFIYLAVVSIVLVGIIPIIEYRFLSGLKLYYKIKGAIFIESNIFFLLMGHFIENVLDKKYFQTKYVLIAIGAAFVALVIECYMTQYCINTEGIADATTGQSFRDSLVGVVAICVYFSTKWLFDIKIKKQNTFTKFIGIAGGATFGIYLLEKIIRDVTAPVYFALQPYIHTMPATLIRLVAAFALGMIITLILKKIPVIKKYI